MRNSKTLHGLALLVVAVAVLSTACGRPGSATSASASPKALAAPTVGRTIATIVPFTSNDPATAIAPLSTLAPTAPGPERPAPTSAPVLAATSGASLVVSGTGKAGLKLRETPNGKVLSILPEGASLEAQGEQQQAAGLTWVHVHTTDGKDGWVSASFVSNAASAAGTPRSATSVSPTPTSS